MFFKWAFYSILAVEKNLIYHYHWPMILQRIDYQSEEELRRVIWMKLIFIEKLPKNQHVENMTDAKRFTLISRCNFWSIFEPA